MNIREEDRLPKPRYNSIRIKILLENSLRDNFNLGLSFIYDQLISFDPRDFNPLNAIGIVIAKVF